MMQRILLTGASGFVGKQVLKHLSAHDVRLTLILREDKESFFSKYPAVDSVILTQDLFSESVEWWANILNGIDIVIHLAWYVEPDSYLHAPQNLDCLNGSLNLTRGAVLAGVKRFVGIGTCFEYDLSQGVLSTETRLKPLTLYASAKASLYICLSSWLSTHSVEFSWCRLFYLYGEGEDERRLTPYVHKQLKNGEAVNLTSGKQIRDYLNVFIAGKKIAETALSHQIGPINICSGIPVTIREYVENISYKYGGRHLLNFGAISDRADDPYFVVGKKE